MSGLDNGHSRVLLVERDETVIAEPVIVDGREMVRYSVVDRPERLHALDQLPTTGISTDAAEDSGEIPASVQAVLNLRGAWSHLDDDEMEDALYHIRHDSVPTPPIELEDV